MAIDKGPDYVQKYWEMTMEDDDTQPASERWEVLEFWGFVDTDVLEEHGVKLFPSDLKTLMKLTVTYGYVMVRYFALYLTHSNLHVFLTTLYPMSITLTPSLV